MKSRILITGVIAFIVAFTSCQQHEELFEEVLQEHDDNVILEENPKPLSLKEIKEEITSTLKEKGDFRWEECSDYFLWSALMHGDSTLIIGYSSEIIPNAKSPEIGLAKKEVTSLVNRFEGNDLTKGEDSFIDDFGEFTHLLFRVEKLQTLKELRKNRNVRFIEPGVLPDVFSDQYTDKSSGDCDDNYVINPNDLVSKTVNGYTSNVSWAFDANGITTCWSVTTGSGVRVGVIDTGVKTDYALDGSTFKATNPSRLYSWKYIRSKWYETDISNPWDIEGHGTFMASAIAAPFGVDDIIPGAAFNCNITTYRVANDVILGMAGERRRVSEAFKKLADEGIRIISMSMGHPLHSNTIEEGVAYAYNKGVIIFCAGGTSKEWLSESIRNLAIYPARDSRVIGVTGIKQNGNLGSNCHWHTSEIDFALIMERNYDDCRKSPTAGWDTPAYYVGGSSVATAMMASIAAMYKSTFPWVNRYTIYNWLKSCATPNQWTKYGTVNVTNKIRPWVQISQTSNYGNNFQLKASVLGGGLPGYTYSWSYTVYPFGNSLTSFTPNGSNLNLTINNNVQRLFVGVTVTDARGFTGVAEFIIDNPNFSGDTGGIIPY